jgi:hypothetical protein
MSSATGVSKRAVAWRFPIVGLVLLSLAACGESQGDRGLSGAGIGAAAGVAVGAVTGLSLLQGAALGAAAGAATGLLTDSDQIDLGDPWWSDAEAKSTDVKDIQSGLSRLGYDPGPSDGIVGPRTQSAIRRYQQDNDLPVDGQVTPDLADHIRQRA